jgi:hypothetical protein
MTRSETTIAAILGAWLGATLFMWYVAGGSFSTVDRVLRASTPQFAESTKPLGQNQTRTLLRYLASEINRTGFRVYGWAQVALGGLLLLVLFRQMPRDATALATAGAMLGLVLVLTLIVAPQLVELGRSLDFVPRDPAPPGLARFRIRHAAFTALDGVKLLAGLFLLMRRIVAR